MKRLVLLLLLLPILALVAWFVASQPPVLERRVVRSVRNWRCPNGRSVDENIVDHFTRAGRPPVRLDWSAQLCEDIPFDWEVRCALCAVVLSEKFAAEHPAPISYDEASSGAFGETGAVRVLSFWPGSFFGDSVEGFGWDAVEACPGIEPSANLLYFAKEDFYWKWARFGRDYSLSIIHPECFRWQKRHGFDAADRMSFEPETGVDPEFVRQAIFVARDGSRPEERDHALEELRALPEIPEDLAPDVARLLSAPEAHAESAETAPPADPATNALTNSLDSGASCVDNSPHLDN